MLPEVIDQDVSPRVTHCSPAMPAIVVGTVAAVPRSASIVCCAGDKVALRLVGASTEPRNERSLRYD